MVMMATREEDEDEELLKGLTKEELAEFQDEMDEIDPDNELLPAAYRVPDQTEKEPTGPFDREHLIKYLKEEAANTEHTEELVPFEKKIRGKVWKGRERKKSDTPLLPDDLSEVLEGASEEELLEVAALLGIHGMLTTAQSEQVEADSAWESLRGSGLRKLKPGITKATKTKQYTDINAINELDLEAAMERLRSDDPSLVELNLNNHLDITETHLLEVGKLLKSNKYLTTLYLANTRMLDTPCKMIADALTTNKTLQHINLESNLLTREGVEALLEMLKVNSTLLELKIANQKQMVGHKTELMMGKVMAKNQTILRFGYKFESRGPRHTVNKHLIRNNDENRASRQVEEQKRRLEEGESIHLDGCVEEDEVSHV